MSTMCFALYPASIGIGYSRPVKTSASSSRTLLDSGKANSKFGCGKLIRIVPVGRGGGGGGGGGGCACTRGSSWLIAGRLSCPLPAERRELRAGLEERLD